MRARSILTTEQQEAQKLGANGPCRILRLRQGPRRFVAQPVEITATKRGDHLLLSREKRFKVSKAGSRHSEKNSRLYEVQMATWHCPVQCVGNGM
jgi:hypothetical protein